MITLQWHLTKSPESLFIYMESITAKSRSTNRLTTLPVCTKAAVVDIAQERNSRLPFFFFIPSNLSTAGRVWTEISFLRLSHVIYWVSIIDKLTGVENTAKLQTFNFLNTLIRSAGKTETSKKCLERKILVKNSLLSVHCKSIAGVFFPNIKIRFLL